MKRTLCLFLALILAVGICFSAPVTITASAAYDITVTIDTGASVTLKDADGDGYYDIGTADELYAFATAVNGGRTSINGELTADITINENVLTADGELNGDGSNFRVWTPIGYYNSSDDESRYSGTFHGNDKTISGLYFNNSNVTLVGLFGTVDYGGKIENVSVIDSYTSGKLNVGGVVGYSYGTVTNCYNKGTVSGSSFNVGGVVGSSNGGTVTNCYNEGTVSGTDIYVGGVVGYSNGGTVTNCYNKGTVSGRSKVGGVVGYSKGGTVTNCYNEGVVSGTGSYVGGVVGYSNGGTVTNCYNEGNVSGTGSYVGGVVGSGNGKNCYYLSGCATDGNNVTQFGIGNITLGSTTADVSGQTDSKTADWFTSGEVCAAVGYHQGADAANGFCDRCIYDPATLNEDEYYEISNAGQLFWFADYINTEDRTANAVLTADIDLENRPWTPIGKTDEDSNNFRGHFDGQNHTIKGLYIERSSKGIGFFGEVRTGIVENFTIYGEVNVKGECDYVGGVFGSTCGLSSSNNELERNGAIIRNITSYVNLTAGAHGIGRIGGFVGYANHETLIENCSWYGTFDAGSYRVDTGAGGFIGNVHEGSIVTIRNCVAYGTIKTNYKKNSYDSKDNIYMGGFLSYSELDANTVLENCLFAGKFEKGENLTDKALLGAFGTLKSVNSIVNCYYLGDDSLEAVHSDSTLNPNSPNIEITSVTKAQLLSGEVAYKLQGEQNTHYWGQTIDTDDYPVLGGDKVYYGYISCADDAKMVYTNNENAVTEKPKHTGGTASCKEKAVCENCGDSYGDFAPHTYISGKCTAEGCGYDCAHETKDEKGICTVCCIAEGTCGENVTWIYDSETTILTITGTGAMADEAPWEAYCGLIRGIDIKDGVTSIGIGAFCGCVSLTSVIIPGSVKIIGDNAFGGCEKLSNVRISEGVTSIGDDVFKECIALEEITIPESVETIGEDAFNSCTMLMTITIPKNVTVIGEGAFCNCTRLTEINVDEGNTTYSSEDGVLFNEGKTELICYPAGKVGDYEVPSGVTRISDYAFSSRGEFFAVTIPVSVTTIGDYAFVGCEDVNLIVEPGSYAHEFATTNSIPYTFNGYNEAETAQIEKLLFTLNADSESYSVTFCDTQISGALKIPATYNGKPVTEIGDSAFRDCIELTSVTIPDSITTIGGSAFRDCTELESVTIGDNVEEIGEYAFSNCGKLTSVTIPDSVTAIGEYAFFWCENLETVTIPDRVTTIGSDAFAYCSSLISVTIGKGVTTIAEDAFDSCANLASISVDDANTEYSSVDGVLFNKEKTELIYYPLGKDAKSYTIPDGVTSIGGIAFYGCTSLESVTIPDSVTTIGVFAFYGCTSLESVIIPDSVTTIDEGAFMDCTALETVTIPGIETTIGDNAFSGCLNVTLLVKEYSSAHDYASKNNIEYITYVGGSGELGKLTFTPIYEEADNENSEITGYSVTDCHTSISGALTIPSKYNGYSVTAIGANAFSNCTSLTSVEIPDSVKTIGENAFKDCSENLLLLVEGGSDLEEYAETQGIVYISFKTDENSNNAEVVDCSRLITGSLTIPSEYSSYSVTAIDNNAFVTCTELTSVIIPKSVTTIGENAFANCDTLNSVEILGNVTIIGARTFEYCTSLSSITIPESVTEIGENAFADCNNLSSITIPEGVTTIGDKAFSNCTSLQTATIENGVTTIGEGAFSYCTTLSSITIPDSVTTIGRNAFDSCTNLESVTIGEKVGKIDDGTFGNCTSLKTIKIPDSVKTIGAYAFKDCSSLKEIAIPESVETIGAEAFYNCGNLKYIFFEGTEDSQKKLGDALVTNAKIHYGSSTHTFNENYTVDTEPTCSEKGSESQHCKYCDLTQNERPVKENGHTSVKGGTEKAHTICDVCEEILSAEHEFVSKITTEPTCTKEGVKTFTCECGYTYTKPVATLGHDKVSHSAKSATCEAIGWYAYDTCSRCDYTTYKEIAKLGHDIVIDKAVEATCTKTGLTEGSHCTRCNDKTVKQNVIPTKAHTEVTVTGKAATCTATGLTDGKKCSVCGATTVAQQTIAKKAHTEVTVTGKAATCTATGLTDGKKCSVCGVTTVEQKVIAATGHKEVTVTGKAATCTESGLTDGKKCSVCSTVTKEQETIKAKGHTITVVGKKDATTKEIGYTGDKVCSVCKTVIEKGKEIPKIIASLATPTVTRKNTKTGIKVSWNTIENAEKYVVYQRVYNAKTKKYSKWKKIKTTTGLSYTDKTVKLGTKYSYTVKAYNGDTKSKYTATKGLTYNVTPTVKVANSSTGVKVTWSTVANATGYTVYSSTYNTKTKKWSKWKNRGTAKATSTSWTDKKAVSGVKYKYTVRAVNGKVKSTYKSSDSLLYLAQPKTTVKAVSNGVKVAWVQSTGATSYKIYRSEYNTKTKKWSSWKSIKTAKSTVKSYTDKTAKKGVKYRYTVKAVNGKVASSYKASSSVKR